MADRQPLITDPSDQSDTANNTPALPSLGFSSFSQSLGVGARPHVSPPSSPPPTRSRPGYTRLQSDTPGVERRTPETLVEEDEEDIANTFGLKSGSGLGIARPASPQAPKRSVSVQSIPRVPIGARSSVVYSGTTLSPPNTGDPFLGGFPKDSPTTTPDLRRERFSPRNDDGDDGQFQRGHVKNNSNDYQRYLHSSNTDRPRKGVAPSIRSAFDGGYPLYLQSHWV
jgi:hypothetical protein